MEEIAGGLKISASTVKKVLAGAGVGILALSAASGIAGGGYLLYNKFKGKSNDSTQTPPAVPAVPIRQHTKKSNAIQRYNVYGVIDPNGPFIKENDILVEYRGK